MGHLRPPSNGGVVPAPSGSSTPNTVGLLRGTESLNTIPNLFRHWTLEAPPGPSSSPLRVTRHGCSTRCWPGAGHDYNIRRVRWRGVPRNPPRSKPTETASRTFASAEPKNLRGDVLDHLPRSNTWKAQRHTVTGGTGSALAVIVGQTRFSSSVAAKLGKFLGLPLSNFQRPRADRGEKSGRAGLFGHEQAGRRAEHDCSGPASVWPVTWG